MSITTVFIQTDFNCFTLVLMMVIELIHNCFITFCELCTQVVMWCCLMSSVDVWYLVY